ncbi:MAG: hypothetical protein KGS72_14765 [Cyanobacteria bacterium REEB67]|nr:hypothetical protein [Cyanobacteria bacterium REEB67]
MLDPERLTYAQWFWIVFAMVLAVMFACRCIDLNYDEEPLVDDRAQDSRAAGNGQSTATGFSQPFDQYNTQPSR